MEVKSALCFTILCVLRVNGLSHSGSSSFSRQAVDKCDLTARPQCSSDCSKILACVSRIETPILTVNCSETTPYCDNGRCVATPGKCTAKMNALKTPFLCTSSGVFPDHRDCSVSHSCSGVGAQSSINVCSRGKIFDSKLKRCVPRTSNHRSVCEKISCEGVTNDFVSFPANPTYYAYCFTSASGVHHTYMYKCDDENNKVFDMMTKRCRFNCKAIGYYADPLDCSSYYICNSLKFASRHVHCPTNYYFNGTVCLNSKAHCPEGSIVNVTMTTPIGGNPIVDEGSIVNATATTTPIGGSPIIDEGSSVIVTTSPLIGGNPIVDGGSIVNATTTTPIGVSAFIDEESTVIVTTSKPIIDNSMADEMSVVSEQTTEEAATTDSSFLSESSTTEASTTPKPTTIPTVSIPVRPSTTKKPSIWKHMGLISVRVGRFLNII